jgi:hypothetical protein
MNHPIPNFEVEAAKVLFTWSQDGSTESQVFEQVLRRVFAAGMKHAEDRIGQDENLHFAWVHAEADAIAEKKVQLKMNAVVREFIEAGHAAFEYFPRESDVVMGDTRGHLAMLRFRKAIVEMLGDPA